MSLQSFVEKFYRNDSIKIVENIHAVKIKPKRYLQEDSDEEETPVYLYTGQKVDVSTDLHILDFPMEVCQ